MTLSGQTEQLPHYGTRLPSSFYVPPSGNSKPEDTSAETLERFPRPTAAQARIVASTGRWHVGVCGRRVGKSTLGKRLLAETAIQGGRSAYCPPTYPMAHQFYRELEASLAPLITRREANRRLELRGGGFIDFWSLENGGNRMRGQKYHRVVVDESQETPGLRHIWEKVIRATLTDYRGDAWLLGTPKRGGDLEWFYRLGLEGTEQWASISIPTAITEDGTPRSRVVGTNNPYLASRDGDEDIEAAIAELESARAGLSAEAFAAEYLAQFDAADSELVYQLDRARTIRTFGPTWAECKWRVVGIDPGGGDPTAIIPVGVSKDSQGDRLHVFGEFYRSGDVTLEMIANYLARLGPIDYVFVGETGGNVLTNSLAQMGFPAVKAEMSRGEGIEHVRWMLESGRLTVSPECGRTIAEFGEYRWARKRDQRGDSFATRTPDWTHADCMDAMRYAVYGILKSISTRGNTPLKLVHHNSRSARVG